MAAKTPRPAQSSPPSGELIETAEAAESLGIHPTTLQTWMRKGLVVPDWRTLGGRARFSRRNIAAVAKRMRAGAGSSSPPPA